MKLFNSKKPACASQYSHARKWQRESCGSEFICEATLEKSPEKKTELTGLHSHAGAWERDTAPLSRDEKLLHGSPAAFNQGNTFMMTILNIFRTAGLASLFSVPLLLSGCGADVSDETAMGEAEETALAQCEIAQYGIVGTPTDAVTIDGVETAACLLNQDFGQIKNTRDIVGNLNSISLKNSWHYEPLVWVLDGVYEIGHNQQYDTLQTLMDDTGLYSIRAYAKQGTVVIVHRNAIFNGNIYSLDDNNTGGGEWGGVVVNGIGYSDDCPDGSGADNFCNVEGPFGYYGGVGKNEDLSAYDLVHYGSYGNALPGLTDGGVIAEAGENVAVSLDGFDGGTVNAAVTAYAPLEFQTPLITYAAGTGLEVFAGSTNIGLAGKATLQNNPATDVILHHYYGNFAGAIKHYNREPAITIDGGEVTLSDLTLLDQFNSADNAVEISNAATVTITDTIISGFDACLQVQDVASSVSSISTALFNCSNATAVSDVTATDYAATAVSAATDFMQGIDPLFTPNWTATNEALNFSGIERVALLGSGNISATFGQYATAIQYPECLGVGTVDENDSRVCILDSHITRSVTLYSSFDSDTDTNYNAESVSWKINGQVMVGQDFSTLTDEQKTAALASPVKFNLLASTDLSITADSEAELVIQPDALFTAIGNANIPVEIHSDNSGKGDVTSAWRGITVNGDDSLAENTRQLNIQYLRIFDAGEDARAALTLNNVGAGSQISYLDIYGAGANGLSINDGEVNIDHLLLANIIGDQISWANGFTGSIETAVISPGDDSTGSVLHGINNAADPDAEIRSRPVLSNITAAGFGSDNTAITLEQGSGLLLFNSVFSEFSSCLNIADAATNALQTSDPVGILFDGVMFGCDNNGTAISDDNGVYTEDPALDTAYVITGNTAAHNVDLSDHSDLIGEAYNYLDNDNYIGAVADSDDEWYANWSDSVVIAPDDECDGIGILSGLRASDRTYEYDADGDNEISISEQYWTPAIKTCRLLGGTYTSDITIDNYSGLDATAVDEYLANGGEEADSYNDLTVSAGWMVNRQTGEELYVNDFNRQVEKTSWTIKGIVHIGDGNKEITDIATIAEMKANPVTLTIADGASLTDESGTSVIHVTRAGAIQLSGEETYAKTINLETIPDGSHGKLTLSLPVVVDGFGRNNQCPDADTAAAGSQVCNIEGEYGYYGGYDDDYSNFSVINTLFTSELTLNSVNGLIEESFFNVDFDDGYGVEGGSLLLIDGGKANIKNVFMFVRKNYYHGVFVWNHGYQGNIQNLYLWGSADDKNGDVPLLNSSQYYPVVYGLNNSLDNDATPVSMPTISNSTIAYYTWYQSASPKTTLIQLSEGSGLFLYNSLVGGYDEAITYSETPSECLGADDSSAALYGKELLLTNIAHACNDLTDNDALNTAIGSDSDALVYEGDYIYPGISSIVSSNGDKNMFFKINQQLGGIYENYWWKSKMRYPAYSLVQSVGEVSSGDFSDSATADTDFLEPTNYLGPLNYYDNADITGNLSD